MANGNAYTPFVDMPSFVREEGEAPAVPPPSGGAPWSPFLSVYEQIEGEAAFEDPVREAYVSVVQDLYDEEFDESLFELLTDARNLHSDHLTSGHSQEDADRLVAQHFSDLIRESESAIDTMAREFGSRDDELVQRELESFAERYAPPSTLEPAFEEFLGKLIKKVAKGVKAVAGKAVQGIAKIGLGPVLAKIKSLIRPLLNRVMQKAIGRLPVAVQPIARKLAERLGLAPKPAPPGTDLRRSRRPRLMRPSRPPGLNPHRRTQRLPFRTIPERRCRRGGARRHRDADGVRRTTRRSAPRRRCAGTGAGDCAGTIGARSVEPGVHEPGPGPRAFRQRSAAAEGRREPGAVHRELPAGGAARAAYRHPPDRPPQES